MAKLGADVTREAEHPLFLPVARLVGRMRRHARCLTAAAQVETPDRRDGAYDRAAGYGEAIRHVEEWWRREMRR